MILVPGRTRYVDDATALAIAETVKSTPRSRPLQTIHSQSDACDFFDHYSRALVHPDRAQLVGVFLNAPLDHIIHQVRKLGLDIVQLHGNEPLEYARQIPVPVLRRFAPTELGVSTRGYHSLPLLDAGAGGSGQKLDIKEITTLLGNDPNLKVLLAGGLTPENVTTILENFGTYRNQIAGVDVSSGCETGGKQDQEKITAFIRAAKK